MTKSPEQSPRPTKSSELAGSGAEDDELNAVWERVPKITTEEEEGLSSLDYVIDPPQEFAEAEISDDAKQLHFLLIHDGMDRETIEWWAKQEGVDLKAAIMELTSWGVIE